MLAAVSSEAVGIPAEHKLVIVLRAVKIIDLEPVKRFLTEGLVAAEAEIDRIESVGEDWEIIAAASHRADLGHLGVIGKNGHHSCYAALNKALEHQVGLIDSVLRKRLGDIVYHYCNRTGILRIF